MGNPIQDWLDRITKPASSATGQSGVGTSGSSSASGRARVGTSSTSSSTSFQSALQRQKLAIAKKTNQEIINAAYKVAEELKLVGGPWPLMRAAKWGHLTDNRGDLYKGKAIDEIEKLTPEQKSALKRVLGL